MTVRWLQRIATSACLLADRDDVLFARALPLVLSAIARDVLALHRWRCWSWRCRHVTMHTSKATTNGNCRFHVRMPVNDAEVPVLAPALAPRVLHNPIKLLIL